MDKMSSLTPVVCVCVWKQVSVGGARVLEADLAGCNGVVHIVDSVIL
jgi:uncharacterized surface protein with fasciclin (FAS1) repeats